MTILVAAFRHPFAMLSLYLPMSWSWPSEFLKHSNRLPA